MASQRIGLMLLSPYAQDMGVFKSPGPLWGLEGVCDAYAKVRHLAVTRRQVFVAVDTAVL